MSIPEVRDDRPLNQREEELLVRLLGDPTKFPIAFKAWLISWLEGSELSLPLAAVNGLSTRLGVTGTAGSVAGWPAGLIVISAATVLPDGLLLCNGASYERAKQARLFAVIGTTYGSVDATHFNVPTLAAPAAGSYAIVA